MNRDATDEARMIRTLARTTMFLADLSTRGYANASPEDQGNLKNIIEALRFWKLTSLARSLTALNKSLAAGETAGEEMAGDRDVSGRITEAVYICKAVKTYLRDRLEDARIFEGLVGHRWRDEDLEVLEDLRLMPAGEELIEEEGSPPVRHSLYLDMDTGTLYRTETVLDPLSPPEKPAPVSPSRGVEYLAVKKALLVPDFPPARLRIRESYNEPLPVDGAKDLLRFAPADVETLVTRYKAFRSNVFAPTDYLVFTAFTGAVSAGRDLYLVDPQERMLRLDLRFTGPAPARFRHHLVYGRFEAILGRLSVQGADPVFAPISIFHRDDRPPFTALARDVAP